MQDGGFTILAVCQGNIHRSALAAALLRTWADWYLPTEISQRVVVSSAGLGAPEGRPMQQPVLGIAAALGADGSSHRARQISDHLIEEADLVLTASRRQRDQVINRVPGALRRAFTIPEAGRIASQLTRPAVPGSIATLREAVAALAAHRERAVDGKDDDIIDPQGRSDEDAFRQMTRQEVPPLTLLGALLFGMPPADLDAYASAVDELVFLSGRS